MAIVMKYVSARMTFSVYLSRTDNHNNNDSYGFVYKFNFR